MDLTPNERERFAIIDTRLQRLRTLLAERPAPTESASTGDWFRLLDEIKEVQGQTNNDMSFVATLLAKDYLLSHVSGLDPFDAAAKPMGSPGLDIDLRTRNNERVIGEIKTNSLQSGKALQSMQHEQVAKDIQRLRTTEAKFKFFFVTGQGMPEYVSRRFRQDLAGITVVLLPSDANRPDPGPDPETTSG